jgi:hypothetical protein
VCINEISCVTQARAEFIEQALSRVELHNEATRVAFSKTLYDTCTQFVAQAPRVLFADVRVSIERVHVMIARVYVVCIDRTAVDD